MRLVMHAEEEFSRIGRHARTVFSFAFRLVRLIAISVGWLLVFCLMLGCLSVTDHTNQGPLVRTEHATSDEGQPSALLLLHPDDLGWTVITRQPITREIHEVRRTQGLRHTYYWNPLTLPAGIFACPASVWGWGWAWSLLTPLAPLDKCREFLAFTTESCLLLLMVARTKPEVFDEETRMDTLREQDSRPFHDGSLTLEWQGQQTVTVPYPIGADGRTVVRIHHLITALLTPWHYPSFVTIYQGGLRIDEARHLEPSDVDEDEDALHIRVKPGWSPKDQEDRDIPLVEPMRTVLLTLKAQRPDARWLLPRGNTRTCQRCGGPTTHIGNLRTAIRALAKASGISKKMTHHILRHCNSTHNRKLGATDYEVMELLGQQSTKVHAIYTHAEWSNIVAATTRLGASIGGEGLSAWLSAQHGETETSDISAT